MVGFLKEKASLTRVASVLSLFTLVAYHRPFFRLVLDNLEGGFNGVMIAGGLVVVMLALNFLVYYLLLFLGRFVGKCILVWKRPTFFPQPSVRTLGKTNANSVPSCSGPPSGEQARMPPNGARRAINAGRTCPTASLQYPHVLFFSSDIFSIFAKSIFVYF